MTVGRLPVFQDLFPAYAVPARRNQRRHPARTRTPVLMVGGGGLVVASEWRCSRHDHLVMTQKSENALSLTALGFLRVGQPNQRWARAVHPPTGDSPVFGIDLGGDVRMTVGLFCVLRLPARFTPCDCHFWGSDRQNRLRSLPGRRIDSALRASAACSNALHHRFPR